MSLNSLTVAAAGGSATFHFTDMSDGVMEQPVYMPYYAARSLMGSVAGGLEMTSGGENLPDL